MRGPGTRRSSSTVRDTRGRGKPGSRLSAPLLWSLVRMTRPLTVVELGCGYTTLFIAQALRAVAADSEAERIDPQPSPLLWISEPAREKMLSEARLGRWQGSGALRHRAGQPYKPTLHCVDVFDPEAGSYYASANAFEEAAAALGVADVLQLHRSEWMEWERGSPVGAGA